MKRSPKPFVVEHKRRSRASTETPSIWDGAAGRELQSLLHAGIHAQDPVAPTAHADANDSVPGEASRQASKGRILEAKVDAQRPFASEQPSDAEPVRRRGRPRKVVADVSALPVDDAPTLEAERIDEPAPESDPSVAEVPPALEAPRTRPTFRQRRIEARNKLPIGERWKWNVRF